LVAGEEGALYTSRGPYILPGGLIYFQGALYTSRRPYILPGGLIYFQEALYTSRRPYILPECDVNTLSYNYSLTNVNPPVSFLTQTTDPLSHT
jgi:hypothetical protein